MTEQLAFLRNEPPVFRPIHYLGCKLRLLEVLQRVIDGVDPRRGRLFDLFSGTGVVAAHFGQSRPVVAVDIQEYARVLADALLAAQGPSSEEIRGAIEVATQHEAQIRRTALADLITYEEGCLRRVAIAPEAFSAIVEDGSIARFEFEGSPRRDRFAEYLGRAAAELADGPATVITRYYGGVYFSYAQAIALDALATAVRRWSAPTREVGLASLLGTASDIVSSVGNQFAQPLRPRDHNGSPKLASLREVARRREVSVRERFLDWVQRYLATPAPRYPATAVRADFTEVLQSPSSDVGVIYADPPYTRDHYSRYYHVLETIALGDEPGISQMRVGKKTQMSRGLYRLKRHQSPFCIKSQAPGAFRSLISCARSWDVPLVLSYSPHGEGSASRPRLMHVDEIVEIAKESYSSVDVIPAGRLMHSKLNAAHLNAAPAYDAEILIVCRPA